MRYLTKNAQEKCYMGRIQRNGEIISANFTLKQHGSWEAAAAAGNDWVESILPTLPAPSTLKDVKTKRNSSGVVGVQYQPKYPGRNGAKNGSDRWLANWPGCPNAGGVSWSIEKFGDDRAFVRAVIARRLETIDRELIEVEFEKLVGSPEYYEIIAQKLI